MDFFYLVTNLDTKNHEQNTFSFFLLYHVECIRISNNMAALLSVSHSLFIIWIICELTR